MSPSRKPTSAGHQAFWSPGTYWGGMGHDDVTMWKLLVWGLVVWDSNRGIPKNPNSFHFRGFLSESKPPGPKPTINHWLVYFVSGTIWKWFRLVTCISTSGCWLQKAKGIKRCAKIPRVVLGAIREQAILTWKNNVSTQQNLCLWEGKRSGKQFLRPTQIYGWKLETIKHVTRWCMRVCCAILCYVM